MKKYIKNPILRIFIYVAIALGLFILMLIPDPIPLIDEIILFLGVGGSVFASIKEFMEVVF